MSLEFIHICDNCGKEKRTEEKSLPFEWFYFEDHNSVRYIERWDGGEGIRETWLTISDKYSKACSPKCLKESIIKTIDKSVSERGEEAIRNEF